MFKHRCRMCGAEVLSDKRLEFCSNPGCHGAYMPVVDRPVRQGPALEEDNCWKCGHPIYKQDHYKCNKCHAWHCPACGECLCYWKSYYLST